MRRPKIYVVNKSAHDFSAAERFGDLVYLSEGLLPKLQVNQMYRMFSEIMADAEPQDYILCTALTQMNIVAAGILLQKSGGRLNMLIYNHGGYVERTVMFGNLVDSQDNEDKAPEAELPFTNHLHSHGGEQQGEGHREVLPHPTQDRAVQGSQPPAGGSALSHESELGHSEAAGERSRERDPNDESDERGE